MAMNTHALTNKTNANIFNNLFDHIKSIIFFFIVFFVRFSEKCFALESSWFLCKILFIITAFFDTYVVSARRSKLFLSIFYFKSFILFFEKT